jgi:hypothetical protein
VSSPIQITRAPDRPIDPAQDEQALAAARKLPSLHEFFSPGGVLSRSDLAYEHRKGQYEMARAIEKAFADKRHLIVEAGTGTGKTLAYLLPALRLARERQQRVIISTGTKNLQEQLFFKDVPFLESILGPLKVCYMKGRGNYLCKHKLYALRDSPLLTGLEEVSQFHAAASCARTDEAASKTAAIAMTKMRILRMEIKRIAGPLCLLRNFVCCGMLSNELCLALGPGFQPHPLFTRRHSGAARISVFVLLKGVPLAVP